MKVLHVLASLNAGGVEKWIADLVEENARLGLGNEIHVVISSKETMEGDFFEKSILSNNGRITRISKANGNIKYFWMIYKFIRSERYDVVHSHLYFYSGFIALIAYLAKVKVRVVHSHNNIKSLSKLSRYVYEKFMRILFKKFANLKLAVSSDAAAALFGTEEGIKILPCGVNYFIANNQNHCSEALKSIFLESRKNPQVVNLVHVGSFSNQKNHDFLLKIAKYLKNESSHVQFHYWFIGKGPLFDDIRKLFIAADINATFLGNVTYVKEFLYNVGDIFLFPSRFEGLGLAAVEAQSQGLLTIVSEHVPIAAKVSDLYAVLSTEDGAEQKWAAYLNEIDVLALRNNKQEAAEKVVQYLRASDLYIGVNYKKIFALYEDA